MENTVLKWSCSSRSKYVQIMSSKYTYKEKLGHVFDTAWTLVIDVICTENTYSDWDFRLERNKSHEKINVFARLISNRIIYFDNDITLELGQNQRWFSSYSTKNLLNYDLNLFLLFKNSTSLKEPPKEEEFQIIKLRDLSINLQELFKKEYMTDVILKCDSVTLKGHKAILCSQSPVFETMFKTSMLEKKLDTVIIGDIDSSVFQVIINFMYSGQVKLESETMAYDLLYAAEKYQIKALKEGCLEYLKSILSHENAIKILEVSNLFDEELKLYCLSYVKDNFEEIKLTKEWINLKLKNPVLALEVYTCKDGD